MRTPGGSQEPTTVMQPAVFLLFINLFFALFQADFQNQEANWRVQSQDCRQPGRFEAAGGRNKGKGVVAGLVPMGGSGKSNDGDVFERGGILRTTSFAIATRFEKAQHNVIKAVEDIEYSQQFRAVNFDASKYLTTQNKSMPMYDVTERGFYKLSMGFTGAKGGPRLGLERVMRDLFKINGNGIPPVEYKWQRVVTLVGGKSAAKIKMGFQRKAENPHYFWWARKGSNPRPID